MSKLRQPQMQRSDLRNSDPSAVKTQVQGEPMPVAKTGFGVIPQANQPGHHPRQEQDKPHVKLSESFGRRTNEAR